MKVLNDEGLAHLWSKMKGTFVPNTLTINDKPLTSNIKITIEDLDIKIANSSTAGLVKSSEEENKIKVNEDGTMEVNTIASATKATQDGNGDVIADTYVKKVTNTSNYARLYGIDYDGSNALFNIAQSTAIPLTIVIRDSSGAIFTATPTAAGHATTKKYVDDAISSNALSAGAGITIADKTINLDYDTLNSDSISSSSGHLSVNTSYIASNICGNGLYVNGCNSVLSVNWESIPIDANSPIHFGSCNQGLTLAIDSSTFYIDSCNGLQINSGNNLLDIGLYGNYGSSYIHESCNSLTILSESIEMDATSSNGQIAIQGNNDVLVHNGIFGLAIKSSNNIILGAYSSNNIDTSGPYIEVTHDFAKIAFGNSFYLEVNANGVYINGNPIS